MNSEQIEDAAARWFWKKDSGEWTEQDQSQFETWLNASTEHRVAYIRLRAGWKGAARMKALGAGLPSGVVPPRGSWGNDRYLGGKGSLKAPTSRDAGLIDESARASPDAVVSTPARESRRLAFRWATAAAALVLVSGASFYTYLFVKAGHTSFATAVGGLDTVPLNDGSKATLNTDTRIQVDLNGSERRIELDRGEAFFDVAKDATRPFVVHVKDKRVTAVGTKFSVRRDGDEIEVVVTEGRVNLEQARLLNSRSGPHAPATALSAGAVARTLGADVLVRKTSRAEAEQILSWRSGYLVFEATPLADAVAEFNRYNARKIVIEDPSIATFRIGGNFRSGNTDAFLWLLKSAFPIAVDESEETIRLSAR